MWGIVGHEEAVKQLTASISDSRVAHAYLIVGPPQVGKGTFALKIAQAVNCLHVDEKPCGECQQCLRINENIHTDVRILSVQTADREKVSRTEIGIDDVRLIKRQSNLKPYEGRCRVFIVDGAENMSLEASNALLKTLEEPPGQELLILLSCEEDLVIPTIRSRCQKIQLGPMPHHELKRYLIDNCSVEDDRAEILSRLSRGCVGWVLNSLRDETVMQRRQSRLGDFFSLMSSSVEDRFRVANEMANLFYRDREEVQEILNVWLAWWRDLLLISEGAETAIYNIDMIDEVQRMSDTYSVSEIVKIAKTILEAIHALKRNGNARLWLEYIMLSLPRMNAYNSL